MVRLAPRYPGLLCAAVLIGPLSAAATAHGGNVAPEPVGSHAIPGFQFPESEATLTRWITALSRSDDTAAAAVAFEKIHAHGWGLWTAVTAETAQTYGGTKLRVFETWHTPDELAGATPAGVAATAEQRLLAPLRQLAQLAEPPAKLDRVAPGLPVSRIVGFTKFDPAAAAHIQSQQLLSAATLDVLLAAGATQIPPFPAHAIVVKPVFQVLAARTLIDGRYHRLPVWTGPPTTPRPFAPADWPGCVWIDVFGGGHGVGDIDSIAATDGSSRTEATTYPVSALIHYRLSAGDAASLNLEKPATDARAGDPAILVAMHVSTREIARWTWQTFWWTPAPDSPPAPSSREIAALRPTELRGAARSYAMSLGYALLSPDQPYTGGENRGSPVYAYNPWIEAAFTPSQLPDSLSSIGPDGRPAPNNVGIQTSCMSCHARANYNPRKLATAPRLSGARYVDLIDPQFVGTLQVDFLWSIARHAR
ncbi:MAG: hypothetical protein HZA93_16170 [Verrucomicrobia bacterium]|nr:hypothetical protein [Verrucomicrobiota bacterium]